MERQLLLYKRSELRRIYRKQVRNFLINKSQIFTKKIFSFRYEVCGKQLVQLPLYMESSVKTSLTHTCFPQVKFAHLPFFRARKWTAPLLFQDKIKPGQIPDPILSQDFINWLKEKDIIYSIDGLKRVNRSHGIKWF